MNVLLTLLIKNNLSEEDFRERLLLAWTRLRCLHTLLQARTIHDERSDFAPNGRFFAVDVHGSMSQAIEDAGKHLVFVGDHYPHGVDVEDFYRHVMNVGRVVDADVALGRAFVLPIEKEGVLKILFVLGHQIADGLSSYVWMRDFVKILNEEVPVLKGRLRESIRVEDVRKRLPLPQEALYPPVPGSLARQRWFWAITRILRHVRRPLPMGFSNPLRRDYPREEAIPLSPTYSRILDYTRTPLLNTYPLFVHISAQNTHRLHTLCKSVSATLGAGIYALAALVAMELHQQRYPLEAREAFITGFPLNPRAFFNHHNDPDSMMLAFSDGIALPFLSADLPLAGRLKLLARQAQHQLASYQKRAKPKGHDATRQYLTSRGAGLVLANQYLFSLDRANNNLPAHLRKDVNIQGSYPARQNPTMQTHGVSSVGNRDALISPGIGGNLEDPERKFAVDFGDMTASVRPREGEFLVGIGGTKDGLFCTPSMDANALDSV
ncbi:hypothetical protein PRZ48_001556 [Zasmidium cellare]|uniref:Alcohol acetyltransferase n=1 Tax=Zasmidium cellare TaxID=395010 RepID=A0ABR0F393_ZASCE|nr:hypothetical protein PRZ48_001556 [Zasmidium cellare]